MLLPVRGHLPAGIVVRTRQSRREKGRARGAALRQHRIPRRKKRSGNWSVPNQPVTKLTRAEKQCGPNIHDEDERTRYILKQFITTSTARTCYIERCPNKDECDWEPIMKTFRNVLLTSALILVGAFASGSAMAQYRGHGGGAHFGFYFGVPVYAPGYYPPPYYAYPVYGYPAPAYVYPPAAASPPTYVEQGTAQAAPAPAQPRGDWYYCADSKAYYPYVKECPAGWQRVPAQPPSG
jgi:hypothetical protein